MIQRLTSHPSWPHVRGALILLHAVAITAGSLPILIDERGLTPETWNDPLARKEFAQWADRIGVTEEQFSEGAWNAASGILKTQRALQSPFQLYYAEAGTRQRWRMFPGALEEPTRLRIDLEEAGTWRTIYLMGVTDPQVSWLKPRFDRDRFRAALNLYAWNVYPDAYEEFIHWLAKQAARDFPDATRLRVSFEVLPALKPAEARAGKPRSPLPLEQAHQLRVLDLR